MLPSVSEIRNRRKNLGITQAELSKQTGISRTSIVKLERGEADLGYSKVKKVFDTLSRFEEERHQKMELSTITLEALHNTPVTSITQDTPVYNAWSTMIEHEYSQLPVTDQHGMVGSITERTINKAIIEYGLESANTLPLKQIMLEPFPSLNIDLPFKAVIPLLQHVQAVLTTSHGKTVGIITNSDINNAYKRSYTP